MELLSTLEAATSTVTTEALALLPLLPQLVLAVVSLSVALVCISVEHWIDDNN